MNTLFFSHCELVVLLSKTSWLFVHKFFSWGLYSLSLLYVCPYASTIVFWLLKTYFLKPGIVMPLASFFFLKIALVILGILWSIKHNIIREIQIKITMKVVSLHTMTGAVKDVKKRELVFWWWDCKLVQPLYKTIQYFLKKLKIIL